MIIYPDSFILSAAAAGLPLSYPRIGYQTYTQGAVPGDVTASTDQPTAPKDAPLRPDTGEAWQPTALPATWELVFQSAQQVDYVGIAGHTLFSSGASVKVEYKFGAGAYTIFVADTAPADDTPLMFMQTAVSANRIRITVSGGTIMPKIAVVYVGVALAMMKMVSAGYRPISMARETVLNQSMSRGGQFLGQGFRRNGTMSTAPFRNLTADWVRASFNPFAKAARKYPYFFGWNPLSYPQEVGYVWTDKDIVPVYQGLMDLMDVSWSMRGVGAA
jgi:hypothetical protein